MNSRRGWLWVCLLVGCAPEGVATDGALVDGAHLAPDGSVEGDSGADAGVLDATALDGGAIEDGGGLEDARVTVDACVPDCTARECGIDPSCGASCGTCSRGTCEANGRCSVSEPAGPSFLSLTTSPTYLSPGSGTLRVDALLTDPDGASDIVGGTLVDPASGAVYGLFTAIGPGSFELSTNWTDVSAVSPITVPSGGQARPMRASFVDNGGHRAERDVLVLLRCDDPLQTACAGVCQACAAPSGGTASCSGAACVRSCPSDRHLCASLCATADDAANCGEACRVCPPVAHGSPICSAGACGAACDAGYHRCGGACVADDDASACGASCTVCPTRAGGTPVCEAGACGIRCASGRHACGDVCADDTDPSTCGSSCTPCPSSPYGVPACTGTPLACGAYCFGNASICPATGLCCSHGASGELVPGEASAVPGWGVARTRVARAPSGETWALVTTGSVMRLHRWNGSGWDAPTFSLPESRSSGGFVIDGSGLGYVSFSSDTSAAVVERFALSATPAPVTETPSAALAPSNAPMLTVDAAGAVVALTQGTFEHEVRRRGASGSWSLVAPRVGGLALAFAVQSSGAPVVLRDAGSRALAVMRGTTSAWTTVWNAVHTTNTPVAAGARLPDGRVGFAFVAQDFSSTSSVYYVDIAATGMTTAGETLVAEAGGGVGLTVDTDGTRYIFAYPRFMVGTPGSWRDTPLSFEGSALGDVSLVASGGEVWLALRWHDYGDGMDHSGWAYYTTSDCGICR